MEPGSEIFCPWTPVKPRPEGPSGLLSAFTQIPSGFCETAGNDGVRDLHCKKFRIRNKGSVEADSGASQKSFFKK
jgi:hypothetical protein